MIRNISLDHGLVKNVCVVVLALGNRLVMVRILKESQIVEYSEDILIPRITFTTDLPLGHILQRRQFPLAPACATTFNSSQGLTLNAVGIDLSRPVFSHGQLYTALSRDHALVYLRPGETTTTNITYHEILV